MRIMYVFFSQWHRQTRKNAGNLGVPIRIQTYDLPITSSDALPLSYRRLVGAKAIKLGSSIIHHSYSLTMFTMRFPGCSYHVCAAELWLKGVFHTRLGIKGCLIHGLLVVRCPTAMPCWWGLTRPKQLSMAATARVIWLCACVKYWPGRGLVSECVTCFNCLSFQNILSHLFQEIRYFKLD